MRKTILLAILLAFSAGVFAYPISPRPLRLLVEESEYIIIGKVVRIVEVTPKNKNGDFHNSHVAVIYIEETLKGGGLPDSIRVSFEPGMICPAPPQFIPETDAVVFLDKYKGQFQVHALSYGVRTLDREGLSVYKTRINEMLDILNLPDGAQKTNETIEWLVKCAESSYTRWDGSYELHPRSDLMSVYADGRNKDYAFYLNTDQADRLKKALLNSSDFQYAMLPMVDIVYRNNEKEMDLFLERSLAGLQEREFWSAGEIMKRLQHKVDERTFQSITEEFDTALYTKGSLPDVKKAINKFISLCKQ